MMARRERWLVAALVALTLAKGLVWIAVLPIFKIADEPAHFDNVQYRAEHHLQSPVIHQRHLDPVMNPGASKEVHLAWEASNQYHRGRHPYGRWTVKEEKELRTLAALPENRLNDGEMTAAVYPGFYYTLGVIPYRLFKTQSVLARVFAVRILSLLFGLAAVLATFFAARLAFDSMEMAFAAACVVAMQPMFSQQTAGVNNDAAVIGMCSVAFYLQMRILARLPSVAIADTALIGATCALAVLSKPQGYGALISSVVMLGWMAARVRNRRALLAVGAAAAGYLAIIVVPHLWAARDASGGATIPSAVPPAMGDFRWTELLFDFPGWVDASSDYFRTYLFNSTWGQFSWLDITLDGHWFGLLHQAAAVAVLGLVAAGVTRILLPPERRLWWRTAPGLWAVGSAIFGVVLILLAEYRFQIHLKSFGVIQGRNFLFAIAPFGLTVVLALGALVPARLRGLTAATIVTGSICLNLAALQRLMGYHYGG